MSDVDLVQEMKEADKLSLLERKVEHIAARQEYLKEALVQLLQDGIQSNIKKLDLQETDTVVFNLPDEMTYDPDFFNAILPIFQEKNVSVIALHGGITIDILRKQNE